MQVAHHGRRGAVHQGILGGMHGSLHDMQGVRHIEYTVHACNSMHHIDTGTDAALTRVLAASRAILSLYTS